MGKFQGTVVDPSPSYFRIVVTVVTIIPVSIVVQNL